jgi:hypothetical protein
VDKQKLRKADFLFSLVLIAFGIVVIVAAAGMPWTSTQKGVSSSWYLSPGLFPALLGLLLIVFSLNVLRNAIVEGGHRDLARFIADAIGAAPRSRRLHRVLLVILIIGAYVFGLLKNVNYFVASSAYLFVFMLLFHTRREGVSTTRNALVLLAVAVGVPLVIGYIFSTYLNVPLP